MQPALGPPFSRTTRGHGHCCPAQSLTLTNAAILRYPWRRETAKTWRGISRPPDPCRVCTLDSQQGMLMQCRCGLAPPTADRAPLASRRGQHSSGRAAHATHSPPNPSQPSPCRPASDAEQHPRNRAWLTDPCQPTPSRPALFPPQGAAAHAAPTHSHTAADVAHATPALPLLARAPVTAHGRSAAPLRPGHVSPPPAGPHASSSQNTPLMQRPAPRGLVRPLLAGPCMHKLRLGPGGDARLQLAGDAYSSQ